MLQRIEKPCRRKNQCRKKNQQVIQRIPSAELHKEHGDCEKPKIEPLEFVLSVVNKTGRHSQYARPNSHQVVSGQLQVACQTGCHVLGIREVEHDIIVPHFFQAALSDGPNQNRKKCSQHSEDEQQHTGPDLSETFFPKQPNHDQRNKGDPHRNQIRLLQQNHHARKAQQEKLRACIGSRAEKGEKDVCRERNPEQCVFLGVVSALVKFERAYKQDQNDREISTSPILRSKAGNLQHYQ